MSYTKGPWTFDTGFIRGSGRDIAKIHYEYTRYGLPARKAVEAEDDANADLIAAAPELLEACKEALGYLRPRGRVIENDLCHQLRVVIAKAEGRQP